MQLELVKSEAPAPNLRFYLGTHMPSWLTNGKSRGPLFVSIRRLRQRKSLFPPATVPYALDSGAYTEIAEHGEWKVTPEQYVADVRKVAEGLGAPDFVAVQDYMCDPGTLKTTGLGVLEHQRRTVESAVTLRDLAPELQWLPVLQGAGVADYLRHLAMYQEAGIPTDRPLGLGSIVRRQHRAEVAHLARELVERGASTLHGLGVKATGVRMLGRSLTSADSIAWSYWARRDGVQGSANSQAVAESYRDVVSAVAQGTDSAGATATFLRTMGATADTPDPTT